MKKLLLSLITLVCAIGAWAQGAYFVQPGEDDVSLLTKSRAEDMVGEGRGRALALRAGYAHGEVSEDLEEEVGLRSDGVEVAAAFELHGRDAWRFDYQVIRGLCLFGTFETGEDLLIVACHIYDGAGREGLEQSV